MEKLTSVTPKGSEVRPDGRADVGPSPVYWISTETWRREQIWSDDYERRYGIPRHERCIEEPRVFEADFEDRKQAPIVSLSAELESDGAPIESGKPVDILEHAPPSWTLRLFSPSWPVCCSRLTTLVGTDRVDESMREAIPLAHFVFAEVREYTSSDEEAREVAAAPHGSSQLLEGESLFHCRACGRVYMGSREP